MDAQSVKNTDTASQKGYDAGKRVSGIKRHIAVDTQALPQAIDVTTAEITNRNGALAALDRCVDNLKQVRSLLADGGYTGKPFARKPSSKDWVRPSRSPNAASSTPSPSCPSDGSSNAPSPGSTNADGSGKAASGN